MTIQWLKNFIVTAAKNAASTLRRVGPTAVAGYLVVMIFGLSFLFVRHSWPTLPDTRATTIAILVAAPLAIALVWHRLTGIKAFGLEVSLSLQPSTESTVLVAAINEKQLTSGEKSIIDQIWNAIVRDETEIIEINLRDGDYWRSTRLYLLAVLADDYSTIQAFAFVEQGVERKFLGMCTPAAVRKALAHAFPAFPKVYGKVTQPPQIGKGLDERIRDVVMRWVSYDFGEGQEGAEVAKKVNAQRLWDWLTKAGQRFSTDSIEWLGVSDPRMLQQILTEYYASYVTLLRNGRLDRIINRSALLIRIVKRALKL